jgi:hypothetical protein
MTLELERLLSPEAYERLRAEAERQNTPVESLVREVLEDYTELLDSDDDIEIEDTPDEVILENFRRGWEQIQRGEVMDAEEAIARIKAKHGRPG